MMVDDYETVIEMSLTEAVELKDALIRAINKIEGE